MNIIYKHTVDEGQFTDTIVQTSDGVYTDPYDIYVDDGIFTDQLYPTLSYIDSNGNERSYTFNPRSYKGQGEPDAVNYYPSQDCGRALNGNFYTLPRQSFNREISINSGIIRDAYARKFLHNFVFCNNDKTVYYGNEKISVRLKDPSVLRNFWNDDCSLAKAYKFDLVETVSRNSKPTIWGGNFALPIFLSAGGVAYVPENNSGGISVLLADGITIVNVALNPDNSLPVTLADGSPSESPLINV